jgi:hypothetical protein
MKKYAIRWGMAALFLGGLLLAGSDAPVPWWPWNVMVGAGLLVAFCLLANRIEIR